MQLKHNRFQAYSLDSHQEELARKVSPYTYAYIQNKVADYAHAIVEFEFNGDDPIQSRVGHERLKAQVEVLEELMRELQPPVEAPEASDESQSTN